MITENEIIEMVQPIIKKAFKGFLPENWINNIGFNIVSGDIAKAIIDKIKEKEKPEELPKFKDIIGLFNKD